MRLRPVLRRRRNDVIYPAGDVMRRRDYAGKMLHHFAGLAPEEWLDSHLDSYVVTVKLGLKQSDWPRRPDGSVDLVPPTVPFGRGRCAGAGVDRRSRDDYL